MAQVANNENNRFTKDCIYEALWELLKQYPYNSITITQIAQKAGVSRNAIYRNFESKDMIIRKRLLEGYRNFVKKMNSSQISTYKEYVYFVFEQMCANKDIAETLIKADLSEFLLESFGYIKGSFKTNTENEFYENYRICGALFVYITWILNGCNETPQQLADIIIHICTTPAVIPEFDTMQ